MVLCPDVVSVIGRRLDCCDLPQRGVIHHGTGKAPAVSREPSDRGQEVHFEASVSRPATVSPHAAPRPTRDENGQSNQTHKSGIANDVQRRAPEDAWTQIVLRPGGSSLDNTPCRGLRKLHRSWIASRLRHAASIAVRSADKIPKDIRRPSRYLLSTHSPDPIAARRPGCTRTRRRELAQGWRPVSKSIETKTNAARMREKYAVFVTTSVRTGFLVTIASWNPTRNEGTQRIWERRANLRAIQSTIFIPTNDGRIFLREHFYTDLSRPLT